MINLLILSCAVTLSGAAKNFYDPESSGIRPEGHPYGCDVAAMRPLGESICLDYSKMPEPLDARLANARLSSFAVLGIETPIVVYAAHTAFAQCQWQCLAMSDTSAEAKDLFTGKAPHVKMPEEHHNAFARMACLTQCQRLSIVFVTDWSDPNHNVWGVDGLWTRDILSWGLPDGLRDEELMACGDDICCVESIARSRGLEPNSMGHLAALQIKQHMKHDGFNTFGELKYNAASGKAEPCTANCQRYADTTGYVSKNPEGTARDCDGEDGGCTPMSPRTGAARRWRPILENDASGSFSRQSHVTPHIGFQVAPITIDAWKEGPGPNYSINFRAESEAVIEELRQTALNPLRMAYIGFYDSKLAVRAMIQHYFRKQIDPTFEEFNFFLLGLSAAEEDALVQVWREKVRHDSIRPTTVIQSWGNEEIVTYAGNPLLGPRQIDAKDFEAFIRVMPHSEFPSGSACLCSAYVEFTETYLQKMHGVGTLTGMSFGPGEDSWNSNCGNNNQRVYEGTGSSFCTGPTFPVGDLQDLKRQCGQSRLWGGMHFAEAVPAGEKICSGIGRAAFDWMWRLRAKGPNAAFTNEHARGDARPTCNRCANLAKPDCRKPDCIWSKKEKSCRAHSGDDRCEANKQKKSCKKKDGCRWKRNRCETAAEEA